jgi:outer membrane biosynthesis protein TonB
VPVKDLAVHLEKYKRDLGDRPPRSVEIALRIALERPGHVVQAEIKKSSGDLAFDEPRST